MHNLDLILTLTAGLSAALLFGYATQRVGLSPIVGYLLAGTLVGPHTPGFVANTALAEQLAEVGVILLMFGVGLQFHVDELLAVRRIAVPGAILQSFTTAALGAAVARVFGWGWPANLVFGLTLAIASTVVLVRVLSDTRQLHTQTGHIAVGWLVVQDIFAVLVLVLLPTLFGGATSRPAIVTAVVTTALKVAGLAAFTMFVGNRLIPWLLDHVAATRSRELFTLTVLVVALGIAVGSALVFGVSMALGAFLAGLVVGRSDYSLRAASEALPMRDAFAVLFFVSIGMLLDPRALVDAPAFIIATLLVVTVGNPVAAIAAVLLLRYPLNVGLGVAAALAQIGEFSFILGGLGRDLGLLPDEAMHTIVAVAMISIVINPVLCRLATRVQYSISRRTRLVPRVSPESEVLAGRDVSPDPAHRAIVVGYGPTGRTVTRLLRDNGIEPTVIELNVDTTRRLREEGIGAVYGDATRAETLQAAGVATAGSLILTSAGMVQSEEVIRLAREMNPKIYILARASYLRDLDSLRRAGADAVFSGEGEVALAFNEAILNRLGATPEQMDRERERAHDELFKTA